MTEVTPAPRKRFEGISPKAYEHPADRAATAALAAIPYLDSVVKRLVEFQYERALRQLYLGNAVKLGPRQLPHVTGSTSRSTRRSTSRRSTTSTSRSARSPTR